MHHPQRQTSEAKAIPAPNPASTTTAVESSILDSVGKCKRNWIRAGVARALDHRSDFDQ
jgi:hypothetical protein